MHNPIESFLRPTYDEILAGLRMRLVPVEQPRDDATGRFVSKRDLMRKQMADACAKLTMEQREAARNRALSMVFPATQRLMRMQGRGE